MANIVVEKRNEFESKQKELADIFEQAGGMEVMDLSQVTLIEGDPTAKSEEIQRRNKELNELRKTLEMHEEVLKVAREQDDREKFLKDPQYPKGFHPKGGGRDEDDQKSLGDLFMESSAFKDYVKGVGPVSSFKDVDMKALFRRDAGWQPETTRTGRVEMMPVRPVQILDIIPQIPTGQASVVYVEETTFTNAAVETAETGTTANPTTAAQGVYQEATLELTERSSPVRLIAVYLPVTDQQLEDVDGIRAYIDQRLVFMLRQRLDSQVVVGNGTAPNLTGFLHATGLNERVKISGEPAPSAIYKGLVDVRIKGRAIPSAIIMHPTDWQNIRLLQDANGNYIMGPPGLQIEPRLWGYLIVESDAITEGTALCGDYANFCALHDRRDVDVQISNSHVDFFVRGMMAIRADLRAAFAIYRPKAYTKVTGL